MITLALITVCFAGCSDKNSSVSNTTSQTESTNAQEKEETTQTDNSTTINTESVVPDIKYTPDTDFEYEFDSEIDGIRILSYTGSATEVSIPKEIEGKNVNSYR